MAKRYLYNLHQRHIPRHVGNKAKNLHALHKKGFPIPLSYAASWDLQRAYRQNREHFPDAFRSALKRVIDPAKTYAVRSSANVEDSRSRSYAGQFLSVLDVQGLEPTLDAIRSVWTSSNLEAPSAYTSQQGDTQDNINMGILLQEMIPAQLSGVAFSRNPVTGMDEVVIEAVEGSGAALLQDGITPQRWIWKWGKWLQQPEKSDIPQDLVREIAVQVKEMDQFGHLSDSGNDFSCPLWAERPAVILNLITDFADTPSSERSDHDSTHLLISRGPFVKRAFRYSRYREQISFL